MKTTKTLLALAILITSLSFAQTNTFPPTGNVRIGTTTDNNVDKLQVNGSILSEGSISSQGLTYGKSLLYTGDLNDLIVSGFFNGENLANAPTTGWFYYDIQRYSGNNDWVKQTATGFGSSFTTGTYVRNKTNLGWQPWRRLWDNGNLINLNQFTNNLTNINAYDNNGGPNTYEYNKLSVGINIGISEFNGSEANAITVMGRNISYYGWQLIGNNTPWGLSNWYLRSGKGDSSSWNQMYKIWHSGNFNPSNILSIVSSDSRAINYLPQDRNSGIYFDFKSNTTDGLNDTNTYHGVMTFRPYGNNTDFSGGLAHQLAFTDNGNMWLRLGSNTSWSSWTKIYSDKNINRSDVDFNAKNIYANGKVGIGTTNPDEILTVNGIVHATEVKVTQTVPADYVFQKYYTGKSELKSDYVLPTLAEIENFTKKNHHLPNVPSAQEIQQKGVSLGEMSNVLLQKVEELTLYAIEQNKVIEELKAQVATLMDKKQ